MTYTVVSVIGTEIYVVEDKIVSQLRLQYCRMGVTIYQRMMKPLPPTWHHHRLMNASTIVSITEWRMSLIPMDQHGKTNQKLDASSLR